ncbi:NAD(P)H-hydrate dehydratase [Yoonia sp.]|uniref:NAD(P)H-hydrate dehydratase n=1 Tax=Yoonia sp. TaxID=2212373 RepID=UPI002FD90CEE
MTELLTAAQMRAIEQAAIGAGGVTGLALMERAGRGVVAAIFAQWPDLAPSWGPTPKPPDHALPDAERGRHRAWVLCGPGNNGGDGFVVARLLKDCGWDVAVWFGGEAEKLPPDAKVNHARWCRMGAVTAGSPDKPPGMGGSSTLPGRCDVLVDALFGCGLNRPFAGIHATTGLDAESLRQAGARCVAVDIVSGLCADSGRILGRADRADLTVSFHRAKCGHVLQEGPAQTGRLTVVDIGLQPDPGQADVVALAGGDLAGLRKGQGHKYTHGHALVLSGGSGKGGAARLAARGALRIGAGAVTVGSPPEAMAENAAQLTAVMLQAVGDAGAFDAIIADRRINALCLGPGLGLSDTAAALIGAALAAGRATVLDADALTLLARDAHLFDGLHGRCVLTPHDGEFARLFPDLAKKLHAPATTGPAYSKVDATRQAAARAGCVVLFKGPDTVIADPSGRCRVNAAVADRAAPWLATAGAGDVLAGFITGLLARGHAPMQAAETAAWLHAESARSFGPGLIAEDLPEELPKVLRKLGI